MLPGTAECSLSLPYLKAQDFDVVPGSEYVVAMRCGLARLN